jgi:hypothetical protein
MLRLTRTLAKGVLFTSVIAAPVTMAVAGVLVVDRAATPGPAHVRPRSSATPPGWHKGRSFRREVDCYTYGSRQAWPSWECREEDDRWVYYYTIEPVSGGHIREAFTVPDRAPGPPAEPAQDPPA